MPDPDVSAVATPETTEQPVAKEGEPKPEHMIPKSRFDEVNTRAKQYERFGTPEQIEATYNAVAYYRELERQAVEEAGKASTGTPSDETAKKLAEARQALYEVDPDIPKTREEAKRASEFTAAHDQFCRVIATDETSEILREEGIEDPTKEQIARRAAQLKPYLESDTVAHAEFFHGDTRRAIRRLHKAWQKDVSESVERSTKAKEAKEATATNKLPRSPSPTGGSPPTGKEPAAPATTMRELQRRVDARLARAKDGEI